MRREDLHSGPILVLVAGTAGVPTWHDLWGFGLGNVLLLGASIFLIGSTMFSCIFRVEAC